MLRRVALKLFPTASSASKLAPVCVRWASGNVADTVSLLQGDVKELRATIEKFAQEELAPFGRALSLFPTRTQPLSEPPQSHMILSHSNRE